MKPTAAEIIATLAEIPVAFNQLIDHRDDLASRLNSECSRSFGLAAECDKLRAENETLRSQLADQASTLKRQHESLRHQALM
jgi:hypothetical protein